MRANARVQLAVQVILRRRATIGGVVRHCSSARSCLRGFLVDEGPLVRIIRPQGHMLRIRVHADANNSCLLHCMRRLPSLVLHGILAISQHPLLLATQQAVHCPLARCGYGAWQGAPAALGARSAATLASVRASHLCASISAYVQPKVLLAATVLRQLCKRSTAQQKR